MSTFNKVVALFINSAAIWFFHNFMHIFQSAQLHANQVDEVYYRVGDKSKKMNFEQRTRLMYAKGGRYFENIPAQDATLDDIDLDFVKTYTNKIGYQKGPLEYLRSNKNFIVTRNPKIFEFFHEYVKEFGEGVDRMFREMEDAKLPEPEYRIVEFMLYAMLKNQTWVENQKSPQDTPQVELANEDKLQAFCTVPRSQPRCLNYLDCLTGNILEKNI